MSQFRDKADLFWAVFEELDRARMKQISEARRTAQEDLTEAAIYIARADEMHAAREKMGQRGEPLLAGIRVEHSRHSKRFTTDKRRIQWKITRMDRSSSLVQLAA